jgi:hypothetical protein
MESKSLKDIAKIKESTDGVNIDAKRLQNRAM